jgi:hypothetical protein
VFNEKTGGKAVLQQSGHQAVVTDKIVDRKLLIAES